MFLLRASKRSRGLAREKKFQSPHRTSLQCDGSTSIEQFVVLGDAGDVAVLSMSKSLRIV